MRSKRRRWDPREVLRHAALVVGGVGVLIAFVFAVGSAHQLNSAHSRLGVYSAGGRLVGVRYLACPGETVRYVELTVSRNGEPQRVWTRDTPGVAALADGLPIPVELESGRAYEVVIDLGEEQAGQVVTPDDPPASGQFVVRDKTRTTAEFKEMAAETCDPK